MSLNTCGTSKEYLKKFSAENGADFVGIASLDRFDAVPEGFHPADLMKSVRSVIVCGKTIPTGSLESIGTLYHKTIEMTHLQLDQIALKIAQEIENNGGRAVAIPTHAPYYYWNEERQYGHGDISIKHAAQAAGLGRIGKSTVFISRDYGILTRLVCILTDIELEPDPILDWEPCPQDCRLCIDACPVNAIKPGLCDQALCRTNIFKKTLKGIQYEDCRECIKACPWALNTAKKTSNRESAAALDIACISKQNNIRKRIVISTLGPEGTCSEYASQFFINNINYEGEIKLYPSFEEAVTALKEGRSDYVIIPSAYRNFADIVFQDQFIIEIADVFKLATLSLVIADLGKKGEIRKVASHSSPSILARDYYPNAQLVISKSNSDSAKMLLANEVDACITTIKCAEIYSLNIVHNFGSISMGWNVLKRKS